jgi:hypothetical protein
VENASISIERALESYEQKIHGGARPFEVVIPSDADEQWVAEELVHPLLYFCESEGFLVPKCLGVVVATFVGRHLYAINAEDVITWGSELLGRTMEQLREQYGTHEIDTALR